ncbi:MAG: ABC transporter permease subunit [Acidobacteria bacterium]|nr:ABC transporter permease subunit [Acidobacteriota bacterium]
MRADPGTRRCALGVSVVAVLMSATLAGPNTAAGQAPALRWGGDAEGGAPFVEADPRNPSIVVGFEVDLAALLAAGLGRTPRFVQAGFVTLDAATARGDFDIALSGIEDTPARRSRLAVTVPYYAFREILTVRDGDRARYRTLEDLGGRRVATLGATLAADLLARASATAGVVPVIYDDDVHPYTDLLLGRVDAVLLDEVLAARGVRRHPGLVNQPTTVGTGYYVGLLHPDETALRDRVDDLLRAAMRDGRLEAIFRRWGMWNDDQTALHARVLAAAGGEADAADAASTPSGAPAPSAGPETTPGAGIDVEQSAFVYLPALVRAAGQTLLLSCLAMGLAVVAGVVVASGRVYGAGPLRAALTTWVEVTRGTPLLLQLFVLYFGLAPFVQLPAFLAAVIGLGLNYGAYESEIYRSALEAVPAGELEAARALGLTETQVLRLVRAPQALRLALAPMTNDFVALLKDSSLVSVITVVELTKQTSIFAANSGSWLLPGLLCAGLYLALSLPLARLARRLERRWQAP